MLLAWWAPRRILLGRVSVDGGIGEGIASWMGGVLAHNMLMMEECWLIMGVEGVKTRKCAVESCKLDDTRTPGPTPRMLLGD